MDQIKAKVKPIYAQGASILVTFLLFILITVAVGVNEWEKTEPIKVGRYSVPETSVGSGLGKGAGISMSYGDTPTWASAVYVLLWFVAIAQGVATFVLHPLLFLKPLLKKKLWIALLVINAITFFITCLSMGLWNSKGSVPVAKYSTSYQSLSACIFFEMVNIALLVLFKIVGGV